MFVSYVVTVLLIFTCGVLMLTVQHILIEILSASIHWN